MPPIQEMDGDKKHIISARKVTIFYLHVGINEQHPTQGTVFTETQPKRALSAQDVLDEHHPDTTEQLQQRRR